MTSETQNFEALLAEAGAEFTPPPGFVSWTVRENSIFAYQYAMRSPSGDLELRFRIDLFARLEAERKAASQGVEMLSRVNLNQMYESNYLAILFNSSEGVFPMPKMFEREDALDMFGADLASSCFVNMSAQDFSTDYDAACVFGFHK